jgi:hypothetical protein
MDRDSSEADRPLEDPVPPARTVEDDPIERAAASTDLSVTLGVYRRAILLLKQLEARRMNGDGAQL